MTTLVFHGTVDDWADPTGPEHFHTVRVGGRDVLAEIDEAFTASQKVTVAIADQAFTGDLFVDLGMRGYGEMTPGEVSQLTAGPHDLKSVLGRYDDQVITMWVSDEPIDLGAVEPS
jgi:hypothetical protein